MYDGDRQRYLIYKNIKIRLPTENQLKSKFSFNASFFFQKMFYHERKI